MRAVAIAVIALALTLAVRPAARAGDIIRPAARGGERARNFKALFEGVGLIYGVDPDLLSAIARAESDYRPHAVSRAGARGLMQLMPETAARYGVANIYDPAENALGAARFLDDLMRTDLDGDGVASLPEVLAAYNAGPGAVRRFGGIPPYCETREYVRRVLWLYLADQAPQGVAKVLSYGTARRHREAADAVTDRGLLGRLNRLKRERARLLSRPGGSQ